MPTTNRTLPVKTAVSQRSALLLAQHQKVREQKQALQIDPLMPLREAVPMLGSPSYALLRRWIADGQLRVWRAGGRGQFRIKLSEVQRFIDAGFGGQHV